MPYWHCLHAKKPQPTKKPKTTKKHQKNPQKTSFSFMVLLCFSVAVSRCVLPLYFLDVKCHFNCVSVRQRNVAPDFSWKSCICIKEKISVCHCPHLSSKSQNKEKDPFPICFLGFLLIISNFPSIQISLWQRTWGIIVLSRKEQVNYINNIFWLLKVNTNYNFNPITHSTISSFCHRQE